MNLLNASLNFWPNRVTLARILLLPIFISSILYASGESWGPPVALALFSLMAFGDLLDGYLARLLNQHSELGAVMDPLADKCILTSATILLAQREITHDWIPYPIPLTLVVVFVARDILILLGYFALNVFWKTQVIQTNRWGKLSTAAQMFLIFLTLLAGVPFPWIHNTLLTSSTMYLVWLCCGACTLTSGISYLVRLDQRFSTKSTSRSVPKTE